MALQKNGSIEEALSKLRNEDLEYIVIGSFLTDGTEEAQSYINTLRAEAFTTPDLRTLYTHIKRMRQEEEAIDFITLFSELQKYSSPEEAQRLNLISIECTSRVASTANLQTHIAILTDLYKRRELIRTRYKSLDRLGDTALPLEDILREEAEAENLLQTERGAKYKHLLNVVTEEERLERLKNRQRDLRTRYEFTLPSGDKERLTLPSGALTFVCAPTSHGKSTLLQNIALQIAQTPESGDTSGDTLYFTFEEDDDSVYMQLLNKYTSTELCRGNNNLRTIANYYQTGTAKYVRSEALPTFNQKRHSFNALLTSGKLRLYYEDYDSGELAEAIKETSRLLQNRGGKLKAVFIDYIQLLTIRGSKLQRREELRDIAQSLRKLAISLQIPIVVAAQLNRETRSPLDLCNENIAEAADLEREANKILCLWNTSFKARKSEKNSKEIEEFEAANNISLGTSGKIYAILTKNRGSVRGIEAVFNYNGNTGVIEANAPEDTPEQANLFPDPNEDPDLTPF